MSDGYLEIWRQDAADQPDAELRLRLLVRDAGAPSPTNLGGLEVHLVGLGEAPNPESGVWVPPVARRALLAWCRALPEDPAPPLEPGTAAPASNEGTTKSAPEKGNERGDESGGMAGRLDFAERQREKAASRDRDAEDLRTGRKSATELTDQNSMFPRGLLKRARVIFPEQE